MSGLKELEKTTTHYDQLIKEFIRNDLTAFQRLYLKDRDIKNVILMGDFLTDTIFQEGTRMIISSPAEEFTKSYEKTSLQNRTDALAEEMDIDPGICVTGNPDNGHLQELSGNLSGGVCLGSGCFTSGWNCL